MMMMMMMVMVMVVVVTTASKDRPSLGDVAMILRRGLGSCVPWGKFAARGVCFRCFGVYLAAF